MKIIKIRDIIRYKTLTIPSPEIEIHFKQKLLFQTSKELFVGEVIHLPRELPGAKVDEDIDFKQVLSEKEVQEFESFQTSPSESLSIVQEAANKLKLDMYFFDCRIGWKKKVRVFLFSSAENIDFRDLLKAITPKFSERIHLHRLDNRDRSEIIGGVGPCGRKECCMYFKLTNEKVSLNAVRDQGIMIRNNNKIYDTSGKIKRCMLYELDLYRENRKYLPHLKQEVGIDNKKARVIGLDILNQKVKVLFLETEMIETFDVRDVDYPQKQTHTPRPLEVDFPTLELSGEPIA